MLRELMRKSGGSGKGFRLELDSENAKQLLEGGEGDLAKKLMELLQGAEALDEEGLRDALRGNPGAKRLELQLDGKDFRMGDFQKFMQAQLANRRPGSNEKDHRSALEEYKPVVADARKATARVLDKAGEQVALATVVRADGYLVTKASELPGDVVVCEFADGKKRRAQRVDVRDSWDLALLKVDAEGLPTVKLADGTAPVPGSFLAAPSTGELPVAIGVASVAPRNLSLADRGFLGIGMENAESGVGIREVQPGTAAAKVGLKVGDVIVEVDGKAVDAPAELAQAIAGRKPMDKVKFRYRRGDSEKVVTVTLGSRQMDARRFQRLDRGNRMGGPLSEKRNDFPRALQHDLTLRPVECGGPLVDLDGETVGVNVARGGRVKSYAIPASDLRELVANLDIGRFSPGDGKALEVEISAAEKEIEAMERKLREARERRKALQEAVEKSAKE